MRVAIGPLILAAFSLACPARSQYRSTQVPQSASPVELTISGPRLIHRGDALKFQVTLTNRSAAPIAWRIPLFLETTGFIWRITDTGGRLLPPYVYTGPVEYVCGLTSPPSDRDIFILQPQEKMEYAFAGDPSDSFSFPGKGFYRVSLKYVLAPTTFVAEAPYRPPDEKPDPYTPRQKIDLLQRMPRFEATSNEWQLYLAD